MPSVEIFQIDTFTDKVFHGNPTAVCLLDDWLNDELLKAIAFENNMSETAFVLLDNQGCQIRWFTPKAEINLCGHATLAAGFLLFELKKCRGDTILFSSMSGMLSVKKKAGLYTINLPNLPVNLLTNSEMFSDIINKPFSNAYESDLDYLLLMETEQDVSSAQINLNMLEELPKRGLILTARASEVDFYSRCFYPKYHIAEDPVTGTAHCVLAPFWAEILNKKVLKSVQGSIRKGEVFSEVFDHNVDISGYCKWYSKGKLVI